MASRVKRNTLNVNGKMGNIGIDMHKQSWRITALVEGEVAFTGTLAKPNYDSFRKLLARFEGNYVRIAYDMIGSGLRYCIIPTSWLSPILLPPLMHQYAKELLTQPMVSTK